MGEINIRLVSKQQIGINASNSQCDITLTPKQQVSADLETPQIDIDMSTPKLRADLNSQVKTIVMPYSHDQLDNLDYESSGHTGFASLRYVQTYVPEYVEQNAVPRRLSLLPETAGFRQGGSIYVDNGGLGLRMPMTALKDLNTKIITTDDASGVDMSKLTVDDFIYERKK